MESSALYGTAAWWRMTRQDRQSDPSKPPQTGLPDPGQAAPRAPFAPPIRDPGVLALLKGLNPPENPVPTQTEATDGELSASYSAAPREAPKALDMAPPEASIVIGPEPPKKKKKPSPEKLSSTFQLRERKPTLVVPVLLAMLVGGGGGGVWIWVHTSGTAATAASSPRAAVATATPAAPAASIPPLIVPIPPEEPARTDPPRAAAPSSAPAPSAAPAKPTKSAPPRRKEDEPDRVL